jgi:hypothetical protein
MISIKETPFLNYCKNIVQTALGNEKNQEVNMQFVIYISHKKSIVNPLNSRQFSGGEDFCGYVVNILPHASTKSFSLTISPDPVDRPELLQGVLHPYRNQVVEIEFFQQYQNIGVAKLHINPLGTLAKGAGDWIRSPESGVVTGVIRRIK